jgi:hypothetical protein
MQGTVGQQLGYRSSHAASYRLTLDNSMGNKMKEEVNKKSSHAVSLVVKIYDKIYFANACFLTFAPCKF